MKKESSFSLTNSLSAVEFSHDHQESDVELNKVRIAINNFIPQESGKSMFRLLLVQLKSFEKDLQLHEFIEEKILIPRLVEMENELRKVR